MLDRFSSCRSFHVLAELNRRRLAIFTTEVCSNIRFLTIPAAPNSEAITVEKEPSMPTTILAIHRTGTDGEHPTATDVIARERVDAQQLVETYDSIRATVTAAPVVLLSVSDGVAVEDGPNSEAPAAHIWLRKQRRWSQCSSPADAKKS